MIEQCQVFVCLFVLSVFSYFERERASGEGAGEGWEIADSKPALC